MRHITIGGVATANHTRAHRDRVPGDPVVHGLGIEVWRWNVTTRMKRLFAGLLSGLVVITGAALISTTSVSAATNLVANPGFETASLSPWTCDAGTGTVVTSPVHSGSYALAATPTSTLTAQCRQTVSVQPNTSYTLSAWVLGNYAYIGVT